MKIATCVSFHGTGSGAVADYLKGFDNITFPGVANGELEFRLLYDPDGIRNLEISLVQENIRGNTNVAIKRFLKFTRFLNKEYSKRFRVDFNALTENYISKLTKFQFYGWSICDYYDFSDWKKRKILFAKLFARIFNKKAWKNRSNINPYKTEKTFHVDISENEFVRITKEYLNAIFCNSVKEDELNVLEQITPTNNISNYSKYFDDLKVIVVDRDPRDCYIQYRNNKEHVYPVDIYQFCQMYKDFRKNIVEENNVLRLHFEDMIYHYEETTKKICDFLQLDLHHHVNNGNFYLEKSAKNTKMYMNNKSYSNEISIIENELREYLYQ